MASTGFDELLAEGAGVPTDGWDFAWFDGRATEQRPSWGYARLMAERMSRATAALDLQTGGGEVLAGVTQPPPLLAATESWPPNLRVARHKLEPLGAHVVHAPDEGPLPFASSTFDLVVSRHPTVTCWPEIARVLTPGGTYFSQQVGVRTADELAEAMTGPRSPSRARDPGHAAEQAAAAGLEPVDLRAETLRMEFRDVAAVVHYLRKVVWIVPGFTVDRFRPQLRSVHEQIVATGSFVTYADRFLIEARRPG